MSRRSRDGAEAAAAAASEAARVLQQRGQEAKSEPRSEPSEKGPDRPVINIAPRDEPRRKALEEIEARDLREKGLLEPAPEVKVPENQPPPTPDDMLKGEKHSQPEPEAPPVEPEPVAVAPEAPKTVRVKVDGEEFDAPQADVDEAGGIKPYQIQRASENRLKKANEALAEARRVQSEMADWRKQQQPAKPPEPSDEEFIKSKVDVIRFGTPEESAAALREILTRSNKSVDPQAIVDQATNKIMHDQAVREFDKEFSDISANPLQLKLAVALRNERIAQAQGPVEWSNFYRTIGNEVRSAFGRPSQSATQTPVAVAATSGTPSQAPSEKEARKASIVNLPTAAARAELPKDSKPETREDILNQARKARGLPTG
jgi:hypothetical protein